MQEPYYAVIFSNQRSALDAEGYHAMAGRMLELAARQPGYLGVESVRDADGAGITVSYWRTLEDVGRWRAETEHLAAQRLGRERWYDSFALRVCRVESERFFERAP